VIKECLMNFTKGDNKLTNYSQAYKLEPGTGWDVPPGLLHAPGDPADLASAITAVLDDDTLAGRLGRHGHALARERHSADSMAAAHEAMYASLARP
jgi:glycosyltransferase involved in cell wall biosynthesis